jgi:hypothetical protein
VTGPEPIKNRRDFVSAAFVAIVALVVLASFGILYTNHEMRKADERWCELFIGLDDNFRAAPPDSLPPRSQKFARQIHKLRKDLHCADTPQPTIQPSAPPSER